jgi:hypothetical protein
MLPASRNLRREIMKPPDGRNWSGHYRVDVRYSPFSMESGFQCASCGEWNVTSVDESAGCRQSYVEDCQVCCKPNVLHIEYDVTGGEFFITSELE